jgi:predicted O-linked N-acetylglucosamine transferase (SPINDLY family)
VFADDGCIEVGMIRNMPNIQKLLNDALSALNSRKYPQAEKLFRDVLRVDSAHVPALNLMTVVLMSMERFSEAETFIARAVKLNQSSDVSFYNYGLISKRLHKPHQALEQFSKALRLNQNVPETWNNRGTVFNDLREFEAAISDFDRAVALNAAYAEAYLNKGTALGELKRYEEALAAYDRALALKPDLAEAWLGRGHMLNRQKRYGEAVTAYAEAEKLKPHGNFIKGILLHQKMACCDWADLAAKVDDIAHDIDSGLPAAHPFGWQGLATSERSLQLCAQIYNAQKYPAVERSKSERYDRKKDDGDKIRIGYLSGEFREQATSHLIVGMLEHHDKAKFEVFGFDSGWDDESPVRKRISKVLDQIIPIRNISDASAFDEIRRTKIDILVNLNGYFGEERTGVFARKPAPIQVNFLGFPGTLGANYIDYIIADRCVIPHDNRKFYNEKVVYLPNTYQANDDKRPIGETHLTRLECGLPPHGFVFCCFNNNYKITPSVFDSWAAILGNVRDSVLWLLADNSLAVANLRKEAQGRGIDPQRLVFAERIPLAEHLARHRLADLFLDTLPYNAHTTASDALWAGLPVLTQIGPTFAGRVAASLLNAIGLPELIARSREQYESIAIELAQNRERLESIKEKLARHRLTTPLFNTRLFTRHIEAAYEAMYRRYHRGLPPDHIEIEATEA